MIFGARHQFLKTSRIIKNNGFTLIEVMIVVAIIAILAAVALPSYNNYVIKTNRAKAQACMFELAQVLERRYSTVLSYAGDSPSLGCQTESNLDSRYEIEADITDALAYTITATPKGAQVADTQCGELSLNQIGAKIASGDTPSRCW